MGFLFGIFIVAIFDGIVIGTIKQNYQYSEITKIRTNFSIESEISSVGTPEINLTIWSRTEIVKLIREHLVEIGRLLIQRIDQTQLIGRINWFYLTFKI